MLRNACNRGHVHESMVVAGLQTTWLAEGCRGSPKKETVILTSEGSQRFQARGNCAQSGRRNLHRTENYRRGTTGYNNIGETVTTKWHINSPLLQINTAKKRKIEEMGEMLSKIPHYWGVLRALARTLGNMVFSTVQLDDLGIANKDHRKLNKKVTFKIDLPFLTNTSPIRESEVLMLST